MGECLIVSRLMTAVILATEGKRFQLFWAFSVAFTAA